MCARLIGRLLGLFFFMMDRETFVTFVSFVMYECVLYNTEDVQTPHGKLYTLNFIDDYSQKAWVYIIR